MILPLALAAAAAAAGPSITLEPLQPSYAQGAAAPVRWKAEGAPAGAVVLVSILPDGPNDDRRGSGNLTEQPVPASAGSLDWTAGSFVAYPLDRPARRPVVPGRFRLRAVLYGESFVFNPRRRNRPMPLAETESAPFQVTGTVPRARLEVILDEALAQRLLAALGCEEWIDGLLARYSTPDKPGNAACRAVLAKSPLTGTLEACLDGGKLTVTGSAKLTGKSPCAER